MGGREPDAQPRRVVPGDPVISLVWRSAVRVPVEAETITWWRIAGEGFAGWAAGTYMRLPEAIAQALNPPTPTPTPD